MTAAATLGPSVDPSVRCPLCGLPAWDGALHGGNCPIYLNNCPGCHKPLFAGRDENVYVSSEGRDWHVVCFGGSASFTAWLIQQRHRPHPVRPDLVADLAEDVSHDTEWPPCGTLAGFEAYLSECNAVQAAFEGLYEAWAEWSQRSQESPPDPAPSPDPAPVPPTAPSSTPRYPPPRQPRHLTGDAAWDGFVALGGDGLAANHKGWHRRSCPAHPSLSGNSMVFKLDDSSGVPTLIVFDHAGCTERQILEALDVDTAGLDGIDGPSTREWLTRGATRPSSFTLFEDPAEPSSYGDRALAYFAVKRGFELEVLHRAGVSAVQHPYRYWRDRKLNVRARFPFTCDGVLVGAWDRAIVDVAPGGRRWIMTGSIPVPFGWDTLPAARDTGHVYLVEGPTDAVALMHALPDAAVLGVGVGRSMWKPWWGPEFRYLTVWLVADNDTGGEMTRKVAHEVLDPYAWELFEPRIPRRFNDLDDWRRAAGDRFRAEFVDAMEHAVLDRRKAV